jgi:hypothetical protein
MGPSECMRHCCVGLTTSTPAALRPSTRCYIPARCTSALRGSRPAPCMACRRMAAISSSDSSSWGGSNSMGEPQVDAEVLQVGADAAEVAQLVLELRRDVSRCLGFDGLHNKL